jgi:peroxiredoxin
MKLKVGKEAPNFELKSHLGGEVRLSDYRGKTVMIAFFPEAWTPV